MNTILDTYVSFLDRLFGEIEKKGVSVSHLNLDHIAFRTKSEEDFERLTPEAEKLGKMVHENYISGNTVRIYKLNTPLSYEEYVFEAIELIGPNKEIDYSTGFEHAEFTIEEDFEKFANRYPLLDWDKRVIARPEFPMLKLSLQKYMQVKFNHIPVLEMARQLNNV